jgi:hypothetical protein
VVPLALATVSIDDFSLPLGIGLLDKKVRHNAYFYEEAQFPCGLGG